MANCERHPGGTWTCGRCMPCRTVHARVWTARLLLEQSRHEHTAFVTLTYAEESLPSTAQESRRRVSAYTKRLRSSYRGALRYFAATERGGQGTHRLHHHLLVFGVHYLEPALVSAWQGQGAVHPLPALDGSAAYTCGYVVKRTEGTPIRSLMSRRPGIGLGPALREVARTLDSTIGGQYYLSENIDVPPTLRFGGKTLPLGQTFRRQLRKEIYDNPDVPDEAKALRVLRSAQAPLPGSPEAREIALAKIAQALARAKILLSKRKL